MTAPAGQRRRIPRLEDDYSPAAAARRTDFLRKVTGTRLEHVGRYSIDPAAVAGNIENFVGTAQVPIGVAGPLLVDGEHAHGEFYVPLATTEGALVASRATWRACAWIRAHYPGVRHFCLESNLATDKKSSQVNILGGGARAARP
jgi:hydroxymethylglutaryl-CoA reductase